MDSVLTVARAGLVADFERVSTHAQNLSNLQTTGYKRQVPVSAAFDASLGEMPWSAEALRSSATRTDVQPGALRKTARPLDLALEGDGYFSVRTPHGLRFTRRGDFSIDPSGHLVDPNGNTVQADGGDLVLSSSNITIDRSGVIFDASERVGALDIAKFEHPENLGYDGAGYFNAGSQTPDLSKSAVNVRSGFLEASNVDAAHEMIGLLEASRRVEMTRNVLTARDQMLDGAINTLASF